MSTDRTAFVMMPLASDFDDVYQSLIREPLISAGYQVSRADDLLNQINILQDIIGSIEQSSLLIADLTTANPNVYYELGMAHAFQKRVVLFTQDISQVPFDLRSYRIIQYSTHFVKMNEALQSFRSLLKGIDDGTVSFGNPVSDFGQLHYSSQQRTTDPAAQSDLGLLDHRDTLEDAIAYISSVVTEVGTRLNELTPQVIDTGEQLASGKVSSTKAQKNLMRALAQSVDGYAAWLGDANKSYERAVDGISNSLNAIFSTQTRIDDTDRTGLQNFVVAIQQTEENATRGRDHFSAFAQSVESLPKIEKEFNRASRRLAAETRQFVGNIDQTLSIFARARTAATRLLSGDG